MLCKRTEDAISALMAACEKGEDQEIKRLLKEEISVDTADCASDSRYFWRADAR